VKLKITGYSISLQTSSLHLQNIQMIPIKQNPPYSTRSAASLRIKSTVAVGIRYSYEVNFQSENPVENLATVGVLTYFSDLYRYILPSPILSHFSTRYNSSLHVYTNA